MNKHLDNPESLLGQPMYSRSCFSLTKQDLWLQTFKTPCILTRLNTIQFIAMKIKALSGTSARVIISHARKQFREFGYDEL